MLTPACLLHRAGSVVRHESMACLFCRIVNKEIPATILFESEDVLAFSDRTPQAPVHALVIPKRHLDSVDGSVDADALLLGKVLLAARQVARDAGVAEGGYRLVTNHGEAAGQSVPHLHVHVLGGRPMAWPPG